MNVDPNYPTLKKSDIKGLELKDRGKVRDIYTRNNLELLLVTTDRISTHDVVYDQCIPHKGFGLTQTTIYAFDKTGNIVENHLISSPDPNVMLVRKGEVYPVEVIVRGILTGSAWKKYQKGEDVCGIKIPKGMKKNQAFDKPIVTPTTKAIVGHDENITHAQARELIGPVWDEIARLAVELFERGNYMAAQQGGMLADTKFEFGKVPGYTDIMLFDEILNHDSSRFLNTEDWEICLEAGVDPDWIDKQLVRNYAESPHSSDSWLFFHHLVALLGL
ncbi:phosphoribosylaminoimidazolesuccinocarboxamide synthase [Candidatus Aenigmatarchaeota archaeon]